MNFDELNRDDLIEMEVFLNIPIISVFENLEEFNNLHAPLIRGFYDGKGLRYNSDSIRSLNKNITDLKDVLESIAINKNDFNKYKYWIIVEILEDSLTYLKTLSNYALWARSPKDISVYGQGLEQDYVQRQNETLKQIEVKSGSTNFDLDWYNLAIRNSLREEDYTNQGGTPLKIILRNIDNAIVESVVDIIDNGLKSYGFDIYRKLTFEDDDLVVLDNKETLKQSAYILTSMSKGDNVKFPELGFDKISLLGSNVGSFLYPLAIRQVIELFSTDDSFAGIEIDKMKIEQDSIKMEINITTRFKESLEGLIEL